MLYLDSIISTLCCFNISTCARTCLDLGLGFLVEWKDKEQGKRGSKEASWKTFYMITHLTVHNPNHNLLI